MMPMCTMFLHLCCSKALNGRVCRTGSVNNIRIQTHVWCCGHSSTQMCGAPCCRSRGDYFTFH
ncbi:hypothetical protein Lalb_Chr08g0232251 [Lupinus albus]|uniref:Secreted protein n=1 Tax=Lupinus albus TaxID=3870 RepID=A0A6A4Q364_LUPAL|nr:hypothetical protein Lalb_Chr08g0232251 [Lupinus albus]